jgi:uncharacterized protein DUF3311
MPHRSANEAIPAEMLGRRVVFPGCLSFSSGSFVTTSCERRNVLATRTSKRKFQPLLLLLLIPFIALCWPPFYNFRDPELAGIPFFYWFQLLWIVITAIITAVVYFLGA